VDQVLTDKELVAIYRAAQKLGYLRCVTIGFLLESPVQIVRFAAPHLSTRRDALQIRVNSSEPFDKAVGGREPRTVQVVSRQIFCA